MFPYTQLCEENAVNPLRARPGIEPWKYIILHRWSLSITPRQRDFFVVSRLGATVENRVQIGREKNGKILEKDEIEKGEDGHLLEAGPISLVRTMSGCMWRGYADLHWLTTLGRPKRGRKVRSVSMYCRWAGAQTKEVWRRCRVCKI